MKFEGRSFIISIGSAGTFNFEIKKTHSSKSKISLISEEDIQIIKEAIQKYEKICYLNNQIKEELKEKEKKE